MTYIFNAIFFYPDPQYKLDSCVPFIKLWEYRSDVSYKGTLTPQYIIIYCITRYITPFNIPIQYSWVLSSSFLSTSLTNMNSYLLLIWSIVLRTLCFTTGRTCNTWVGVMLKPVLKWYHCILVLSKRQLKTVYEMFSANCLEKWRIKNCEAVRPKTRKWGMKNKITVTLS